MTPERELELQRAVDLVTRNGLHELLRERPELLDLGPEIIATIYRAGVIAGASAIRQAIA